MITTKEDLMQRLTGMIGDNTSDDAIALIEDITDTLVDYEEKTADQTNWKQRFEENDSDWRKRYLARFNGRVESDADFVEEPKDADETIIEYEKPKTYEDLFKVGEE